MWLPSEAGADGNASRNPPPDALERHAASLTGGRRRRQERICLASIRPVIHVAHRTRAPLVLEDRVIVDHALVLVLRGSGELVTESAIVSFEPGRLLLIPPYVRHRFTSRPGESEHIAVHFALSSDFMASRELREREPYEVVLDGGVTLDASTLLTPADPRRARLEKLVRLWAQDTPLATLRAEAALLDVVTTLLRSPEAESSRPATADPRIERSLAEIERRIAEPISVAELARSSKLGVSRFSRLFFLQLGQRPAFYIRQRRLERARQLLEDTETPINAIAVSCGFRSAAHFSRTFLAAYGAWPSRHRQQRAAATPTAAGSALQARRSSE